MFPAFAEDDPAPPPTPQLSLQLPNYSPPVPAKPSPEAIEAAKKKADIEAGRALTDAAFEELDGDPDRMFDVVIWDDELFRDMPPAPKRKPKLPKKTKVVDPDDPFNGKRLGKMVSSEWNAKPVPGAIIGVPVPIQMYPIPADDKPATVDPPLRRPPPSGPPPAPPTVQKPADPPKQGFIPKLGPFGSEINIGAHTYTFEPVPQPGMADATTRPTPKAHPGIPDNLPLCPAGYVPPAVNPPCKLRFP